MDQVHGIPFSTVLEYLALFPDYPIVSVGSGNGTIEYELKEKEVKNLILVDPDPESFKKYPSHRYLKPNFSNVKNLLKAQPDLVGNSVLFLCWPSPKNSHFDAEAISLLK